MLPNAPSAQAPQPVGTVRRLNAMLIIETGAGVPNANSYVSEADLRAYMVARGMTVPVDDANEVVLGQHLLAAMDYLQIIVCGYKGTPTYPETQTLLWPRTDVYIHGVLFAENQIPQNLKLAQIRLAIDSYNGVNLMPTISGNASDYVVEEKVGPIEVKYADATKFSGQATFTAVDSLLAPLIAESCGQGFTFGVYRG